MSRILAEIGILAGTDDAVAHASRRHLETVVPFTALYHKTRPDITMVSGNSHESLHILL